MKFVSINWENNSGPFWFHMDKLWLNPQFIKQNWAANSVNCELLNECEAEGCTHTAEGLSALGAGGLWGFHWKDSTWENMVVG